MPRKDGRNELYPQLLRRMTESGDYDRISWALTQKLNESGWLDDHKDRAKEMVRSAEGKSVETIMSELRPRAEVSIPPKFKQEIMAMIRQYLEKQIEG